MSVLNRLKKKRCKILACCAALITGITLTPHNNALAEDEVFVEKTFESNDNDNETFEGSKKSSEKSTNESEDNKENDSTKQADSDKQTNSNGKQKIYNRDTDFTDTRPSNSNNQADVKVDTQKDNQQQSNDSQSDNQQQSNNQQSENDNQQTNNQNSTDTANQTDANGKQKIYNRDTDFEEAKPTTNEKAKINKPSDDNKQSESDKQTDTTKNNTDTDKSKIYNNDTSALDDNTNENSQDVNSAARESMRRFEGKTIVDIEFEGASDLTLPTVKVAINQHVGDEFSADTALKDSQLLLSTGYFYDLYQTFDEVPEGVIIKYHLMENPILKDIVIVGNTVEDTKDLERLITVRKGDVLNSVRLHDNIIALQEKYRSDGYVLMKITDMNIDKEGILTLKINEGVLEGYKVKGNKKTKEKVIMRELRQKPGEVFNANLTRRSMQRINNLGFFEDVNVQMKPGVEPNAIVLEINVKEKRTGTFGIGAGYSSEDGIIGMVSIADTNFRGTGDAVSVTYEVSGDDEDAHGFTFSYRRPWLDKKETAGTFRFYNRTYEYDDYDTRGHLKEEYMRKYVGGEITLGRPVSEYSTNYITLRNRKDEYVKHVSNGNAGNRSGIEGRSWRKDNFGTTRSITLEHVTDTRDNIYNPMTGGRVNLSAEFGGLIGGDFDFQKYSIEHQQFFKAGRAQVWALRTKGGIGFGDISEFNQYRIGGQNTLRGYREDQFRGDRVLLGTLEYRFPLFPKVQGALFTDWGSAWDTGFEPDDFHGSVGVGLALTTPLGPLRLDYGRGSQGGRVHFSVGGTF